MTTYRTGHRRTGVLASLQRLLAATDAAFCELARIQFGAPWQARKHHC